MKTRLADARAYDQDDLPMGGLVGKRGPWRVSGVRGTRSGKWRGVSLTLFILMIVTCISGYCEFCNKVVS